MENQKKKRHGLLVSALVVLIAGVAMCGGAIAFGGLSGDAWVKANRKLRAGQGLYEEPKSMSFAYDIGEISSLDFDISSSGVIVEKGTGGGFALTYYEDFEGEFTVNNDGGKLTVKQNNTNYQGKGFFKYFQTNMDWVVGFFDGWNDNEVKLTVPAGVEFDSVDIKCSSGSVRVSDIVTTGKLDLSLSSGSLRLNNVTAGGLTAKLASGTAHFNNVAAPDISATLSSGGLNLTSATADKLTAKLSSGSLRVNSSGIKVLDINLSSGGAALTSVTADELTARLASGSLKVNSSDIKASHIDLSSGGVTFGSLPAGFTSAATAFNIKVNSGAVRVDGAKQADSYVTNPSGAEYKIEGRLGSGSFRFN